MKYALLRLVALAACSLFPFTKTENLIASSDRNDIWHSIWEKKGRRGLVAEEQGIIVNGYDTIDKEVWQNMSTNILNFLQIDKAKTMWDFGCGSGELIKLALAKNPNIKVFGCDYSQSLINLAQKNIPQGNFWVQNITKQISPSYRDMQVDVAICYGVLLYLNSLEDIEKALLNMVGIIKPGGHLFVGEVNDLAKKELADALRMVSHSDRNLVDPTKTSLDHLYISRDFLSHFAEKYSISIEFLEFDQFSQNMHYTNAPYRFHFILSKPLQ